MPAPAEHSSLIIPSPLGDLMLVGGRHGLALIVFLEGKDAEAERMVASDVLGAPVLAEDSSLLHRARRQLSAWFEGRRRGFTLPLDLRGTPFQMRVWDALQRIPWGETASYGELARSVGRPTAARAVAHAASRNPLPMVVPCHRLIASDGSLGGYAGGVARKRRLLALERGSAPDLPLFSVAAQREEDESRHRAHARVLGHLPPTLAHRLEDLASPEPGPSPPPMQLAGDSLEALTPEDVAVFADVLAERAATTGSRALHDWAEEMMRAATVVLDVRPPGPTGARCLLHASVALQSSWYVALARRLASLERLTPATRRAITEFLESVLDGTVAVSPYHRERTVDVWLLLRERSGDDHWIADRRDDRSAALMGLGLWREAAVAAGQDLAEGHGSRRTLLLRLVDLYERLDDHAAARDRLVALLAERDDPGLLQRLRKLDDHRPE